MNGGQGGLLPSIVILGGAAAVALVLTVIRGWADDFEVRCRAAVRTAAVTIIFQAVHFAEELLTGLQESLPALFGLPPIGLGAFVSFNLAWLAIWSASAWGMRSRRRLALFPLWFLAIGSVANGIGHPLLSVVAGGYFPGVLTAPVSGILGVLLLRSLTRMTQSGNGARS